DGRRRGSTTPRGLGVRTATGRLPGSRVAVTGESSSSARWPSTESRTTRPLPPPPRASRRSRASGGYSRPPAFAMARSRPRATGSDPPSAPPQDGEPHGLRSRVDGAERADGRDHDLVPAVGEPLPERRTARLRGLLVHPADERRTAERRGERDLDLAV